jgi:hypothetical protein
MFAMLAKRGHKRSIIPNGTLFFAPEPLEHFETMSSKLSQDCARVMQFI